MKSRRYIFVVLTLIWVAVIFGFSLQPAEISDGTSISFLQKIVKIFMPWFLDDLERLAPEKLILLNFIVRKCAHFTEYFILGVLSTVTVLHMTWTRRWVCGLGFCVAIACLDECLQLFVSGRSGKVLDVLIDGAGALVGLLVVCLAVRIIHSCKKSRGGDLRYGR